ncbi:hypothetical protein CEXT_784781 [Caerostris extrusa]|uniref:Uncharacterized protein n=1 Tax=Caerostris extrusa TaxID=172846 RepID=A0AAV4UKS9_CAEEX|nr:hypothetical protein CEXT_784781 [Caerostris extrusa]
MMSSLARVKQLDLETLDDKISQIVGRRIFWPATFTTNTQSKTEKREDIAKKQDKKHADRMPQTGSGDFDDKIAQIVGRRIVWPATSTTNTQSKTEEREDTAKNKKKDADRMPQCPRMQSGKCDSIHCNALHCC